MLTWRQPRKVFRWSLASITFLTFHFQVISPLRPREGKRSVGRHPDILSPKYGERAIGDPLESRDPYMKSIIIILICFSTIHAKRDERPKEWRGLRPMHSNCEDVKRALKVTTCSPPGGEYDFTTERVRIVFSSVECDRAWQRNWKVPPGTVLSIERHFRQRILLSEFVTDLDQFELAATDDGLQIYSSKEQGISVWALGNEIRHLYYEPTSSDEASLLCNCAK